MRTLRSDRPAAEILESRTLLSAGDLDPSFGGGGKLFNHDAVYQRSAEDVAVQADGKTVIVGSRSLDQGLGFTDDFDVTVSRYNPDGSPDATFGNGRFVVTNLGGSESARRVKIASDGRIVVGGDGTDSSGHHLLLLRYLPDGSLDPSFGAGGIVRSPLTSYDSFGGLDLAPGGKVVAGTSGQQALFTVLRFTASGSPDPTFGGDGRATVDFDPDPRAEEFMVGIATLPDGRVVTAGGLERFGDSGLPQNTDVVLARLTDAGTLDPTFGNAGKVRTDTSANELPLDVALDSGGRVVVGGARSGSAAVWRYTPGGALDTTFGGGDGVATLDLPVGGLGFQGIAVAPGDRIVGVGGASNELRHDSDFVTARLTADGTPDATFNGTGYAVTDFYGGNEYGRAVAVTSDGKVVTAGDVNANDFSTEGLVRFNPDGSPDPSFGAGGKVVGPFEGARRRVYDTIVQPDRKIVVGGSTTTGPRVDFFVARYNPDGSPDRTFDGDGVATTDVAAGRADEVRALLLEPDGRIVAVGTTTTNVAGFFGAPGINGIGLVRYNADGSLDTTFGGGDGKAATDFAGGYNPVFDVAAYPGGKLVVAGGPGILRFDADGTPDASFDGDGVIDLGAADPYRQRTPRAVLVQGDKVLAGLHTSVARFIADGSRDATFASPTLWPGESDGGDDAPPADSHVTEMAFAPDGDVIVLGHLHDFSDESQRFVLWRINPDGSIDTAFDGGKGPVAPDRAGVWVHPPFAYEFIETGLAVQSDGKIVVSGWGENSDFSDTEPVGIVSRLLPDGRTDTGFGLDGFAPVFGLAPEAVAVDSHGDIVVGGQLGNASRPATGWGIARLDGTGDEGSVTYDREARLWTIKGNLTADSIQLNASRGRVFATVNGRIYSATLTSVSRVWVYGRGGDDSVTVSTAVRGLIISGGAGNDLLRAGPGGEGIAGDAGNDTIDGGLGADTMSGGAGTDSLDYRSRTRPVRIVDGDGGQPQGEAGENDSLFDFEKFYGGSGDDQILIRSSVFGGAAFGGAGNDTLRGNGGPDALWGGDGDDVLFNSDGADYVRGGNGTDTFVVAEGNDTHATDVSLDGVANDGRIDLFAGSGVEGDNVNTDIENITGGLGNDRLTGSAVNNRLEGGGGNDTLMGLAGDDTLLGGAGNDTLTDTQGNNTLDGGPGTDTVNGVVDPTPAAVRQAGTTSGGLSVNGNPRGSAGTGRRSATYDIVTSPFSDRPLELRTEDVVL